MCTPELKVIISAAIQESVSMEYKRRIICDTKRRELDVPNPHLKLVQKQINKSLQDIYANLRPSGAYGYMRACNGFKFTHTAAAGGLLSSRYIYKFDIKEFFRSVKADEVRKIFEHQRFNLNENEVLQLVELTTYQGRLPFGAPSSPAIINFLFLEFDRELPEQLKRIDASTVYCRYCDDILIGVSANERATFHEIKSLLNRCVNTLGLKLNNDKTTVLSPNKAKYILGLKVNERVNIDRKYIRNLRAALNNYKNDAQEAVRKFKQLVGNRDFLTSIRSKIEYVGFVRGKDDEIYLKLLRLYLNSKIVNWQKKMAIFRTEDIWPEDGTIRNELFENFMNFFGTKEPTTEFLSWLSSNQLGLAIRNIPQTDEFYDGTYFKSEFKGAGGQAVFVVDKKTLQPVKLEFNRRRNTWDRAESSEGRYVLQTFPESDRRTPLEVAKSYAWVNRVLMGLGSTPTNAEIEKFVQDTGLIPMMEAEQKQNRAIREYFNFLSPEQSNTALEIDLSKISVTSGTLPFVEKVSKAQRDKGFSVNALDKDLFKNGTLRLFLPVTSGVSRGIATKAGRLYLEVFDNRLSKPETRVSKTIDQNTIITIPVLMSELKETTVPVSPTQKKNALDNLSDILALLAQSYGKSAKELEGVLTNEMKKDFQQFISDNFYTGKKIKVADGTEVYMKVLYEFSEINGQSVFTPSFHFRRDVNGKPSSQIHLKQNQEGNTVLILSQGGKSKSIVFEKDNVPEFSTISENIKDVLTPTLLGVRANLAMSYDDFTSRKDPSKRDRLPIASVKLKSGQPILSVQQLINDDFLQTNASNLNEAVRNLYYQQYVMENLNPTIPLKLNLDSKSEKPNNKVGRGILFEFPSPKASKQTAPTEVAAKEQAITELIKTAEEKKQESPVTPTNSLEQTDNSSIAPTETKKKTRPNRQDIDVPNLGDFSHLLSSKLEYRITSQKTTPEQVQKIKSIFGSQGDQVNIQELYNIVNQGAWATWSPAAITLYHGANSSDLYHEAWHHFSQLYLTKDEKIRLYTEVREKQPELREASDKQVEEHVAREFALAVLTDKNEGALSIGTFYDFYYKNS